MKQGRMEHKPTLSSQSSSQLTTYPQYQQQNQSAQQIQHQHMYRVDNHITPKQTKHPSQLNNLHETNGGSSNNNNNNNNNISNNNNNNLNNNGKKYAGAAPENIARMILQSRKQKDAISPSSSSVNSSKNNMSNCSNSNIQNHVNISNQNMSNNPNTNASTKQVNSPHHSHSSSNLSNRLIQVSSEKQFIKSGSGLKSPTSISINNNKNTSKPTLLNGSVRVLQTSNAGDQNLNGNTDYFSYFSVQNMENSNSSRQQKGGNVSLNQTGSLKSIPSSSTKTSSSKNMNQHQQMPLHLQQSQKPLPPIKDFNLLSKDTQINSNVESDLEQKLPKQQQQQIQIPSARALQQQQQQQPNNMDITMKIIELVSSQIQNDPENPKLYEKRMNMYMKAGDFQKAIADVEHVLHVDSLNINALYSRGNANMQMKQYKNAIDDFQKVLSIDPNHVNAALAIANCFNFMGDYGKAIDQYEDALEKDFEKGSMANLSMHFNKRNNLKSATSLGSSQLGGYFDRLEEEELLMNQNEQYTGFRILPQMSKQNSAGASNEAKGSARDFAVTPNKPTTNSTGAPKPHSLFRSQSQQIDQREEQNGNATTSNVRSFVSSECASPSVGAKNSLQLFNKQQQLSEQQQQKLQQKVQFSSQKQLQNSSANQIRVEGKDSDEQANAYFTRGYQARQSEDYWKAIELYSVAISLKPAFLKAVFNRGFLFDKLGEFAKACEDYTRAIEIDSKCAFAYFNRGITLDKLQQLASALDDFTMAISFDQKNPDFFLNRGNVLQKLEQHAEAIEDFSTAIDLGTSKKAAVLISRALSYEKCKELERAKHDYQRALDLNTPSKHICYSRLASIFYTQDNIQLALTLYNNALKENSSSLYCLAKRAQLYLRLKLYKLACDDLTEAISLNPTISSLFFYRGKTNKLIGKTLESTEDYLCALSLKPLDEETLSSLSENLIEMGEFEESKKYIDVEIDEFGESDERLYKHHICSIRMGDYSAAEIDLKKVLKTGGLAEIGEENLALLRNLSACLMRQKKYHEAEEVLTKIINRTPEAKSVEEQKDFNDLISFRTSCREKLRTTQ